MGTRTRGVGSELLLFVIRISVQIRMSCMQYMASVQVGASPAFGATTTSNNQRYIVGIPRPTKPLFHDRKKLSWSSRKFVYMQIHICKSIASQ